MTHMTTPPMTSAAPMITRLSRCLPITLVSRNAGAAVQTKAITTSVSGWVTTCAVAALAVGKGRQEFCDALAEIDGQRQNRAQLDHDGEHLPISVIQGNAEQRLADAQMRGGADRKELGQPLNNSKDESEKVIVHSDR